MAVSVSATTRTNGCTAISSCTIPQTPFFQNLSFPLNFRPIPTNSFHLPRLKRMLAISNSRGTESNVLNEKNVNVLDNVKVYDLSGKGVPISDLWKDRRAVVAFARHFGCVLCRKRADDLAAVKDKMDAAGVALVLIGRVMLISMGCCFGSLDTSLLSIKLFDFYVFQFLVLKPALRAKTFRAQTEFRGEIYADPSHASYTALRFVSGVSTTFTPGVTDRIGDFHLRKIQEKEVVGNKVELLLQVRVKLTYCTSTRIKKQEMIHQSLIS